jgi:hypothetical protein
MTPFNSTPVVWIAFESASESESLAERIASFADARVLEASERDSSAFLHTLGKHQTGWLLVDESVARNAKFQALGRSAAESHEFFRCMIIGKSQVDKWPENSIFLAENALSTTIIDRLRNETHVLRMISSRMRHVRRLQSR